MKRWDLLGVTTGAFFVTMVARLAPSPLVPDVIDAFGVSTGTVGLALSGMFAPSVWGTVSVDSCERP